MNSSVLRPLVLMASLGLAAWLAGCTSAPQRAPVEDRAPGGTRPPVVSPAPPPPSETVKLLPGAENAGKPGYYTVRPGDTLARIALDNGQTWRDVARWNGLDNPNVIEVGQVLRVLPPQAEAGVAMARAVPAPGRVETRPIDPRVPASGAAAAVPPTAPAAAAASTAGAPAPSAPAAPRREGEEDIDWLWPATGTVLSGFDETRNAKGLAIGGKPGDPVLAAADGRVVYAGSGLRGYGNLVIVKHNNTYLTAYAHNQVLLVKEDQPVRRGQKIAEMGSSDADRVQLHFEIRRMGKPVDPAKLLPPR